MSNLAHDLGFISSPGASCGLPSCNRNGPHFHCRICGFGTSQVGNVVAHARLCSNIEMSQKEFSSLPSCSEGMYSTPSQPFSFYPQVSQTTTTSKMISTQQSAMFNFVIPPQNAQYGGLYGPQTVFPNPNLFSPSGFNNFSQIDSWTSRLLSVHPTGTSPSDGGSVMPRNTNSPSCCRTDNFPMPSPDKVKDIQPQNWYCGPQVSQAKYPDSTTSSCSISLLLLDQPKDEFINVDDLCFSQKTKEPPIRSSCMQAGQKDEESSSSSSSSDIVVEDSDSSEGSDTNEENNNRCLVCELTPIENDFVSLDEKTPLTNASKTAVHQKICNILNEKQFDAKSICTRCLDLINLIDTFEVKLATAVQQVKQIYKTGKENKTLTPSIVENTGKSLVCQICDKSFSSPSYLAKHKQHHTKSFSYCCEYCGKGFTGLQKLENHVLLHSKTLRFQCELCGKQFLEKHTLTNHIRQHKGEHRHYCSICQKGFVLKSVFKHHLQTHSEEFFICQYCGRKIKTYSHLMVHVQTCSGDLKFSCPCCEKRFPLKYSLDKHILMDHKARHKYECTMCQKGFWKKSDFDSHLITHTNDKPFKCLTCGNCYKSKKNLKHHARLHGSGPNFKCKVCGKDFTRCDALTDHMNQHTGRKPYQCQTCLMKFANRINLNVHIKKHSNDSMEKTTAVSKKEVTYKAPLEEKRFTCIKCLQQFVFKNSLVKHMKSKHGESGSKKKII